MQLILVTLTLLIATVSMEKKNPYLMDMFPPDSETKFDLETKCNLTSIRNYLCSENFNIWPCQMPCILEAVGLMQNNTFMINEAYNNVVKIHPDFDKVDFRALVMMCEAEKSYEWNGQDRCLKTRRLFKCLIRNNDLGDFWGISEDCSLRKKKVKAKNPLVRRNEIIFKIRGGKKIPVFQGSLTEEGANIIQAIF